MHSSTRLFLKQENASTSEYAQLCFFIKGKKSILYFPLMTKNIKPEDSASSSTCAPCITITNSPASDLTQPKPFVHRRAFEAKIQQQDMDFI